MIQPERKHTAVLGGTRLLVLAGLALASLLLPAGRASAQIPGDCQSELNAANLVDNDFGASFCELCSTGTIRIVVQNSIDSSDDIGLSRLVVTEDLQSSGLTYVPFTTQFQGVNVGTPAVVEPAVSGPNGSILTWTLPAGFTLAEQGGAPGDWEQLIITFDVQRHASLGDEGLVSANRSIDASVDVEPSCAPGETYTQNDPAGTLSLREPVPNVRKRGRNVDAGQAGYTDTVYAHEDDDVIWRIRIRNDGQAPLQDFRFTDSMVPGNFVIHHVCDSSADALSAANGGSPASCVAFPNVTSIVGFDVAGAFGGGANPYIVAAPGATRHYYLIGRVTDSCTNRDNSVLDVQWGCQDEPPVGGIVTTSSGFTPGDTETLNTLSVPTGVSVSAALTGRNTAQPMGARGLVSITIDNNSGGTIHGGAGGIDLHDLLPAEYVVDTSAGPPTLAMAPAYGNAYPGMVDTIAWTNPAAGTVPLVTADPNVPLQNRDLHFVLTSSTVHPDPPNRSNMIRHGDVVTITVPVVLIDPTYYDLTADIDVRIEDPAGSPPNTDPTASFPVSNELEIWFEEYCTGTQHNFVVTDNDTARPEDLDVDLVGTELLFILTSTGDPLPLTVALTNNGGHDATDYETYVTFGEAMVVSTVPSGCAVTTNPPLLPNWQLPATLPATASVYRCERGTISPGEWELFNFEVVKNTAASFDDDLTFRADVIGEIELVDGTPLWFPAPVARADGITDRANDYSIDAVRARVVGYDLFKAQAGICTENNPPPGSPDDQIQIGEECTFHVESGGWFGFETPGFTYIAVQNVQVVDQNPDGQGYLRSTDPLLTSTAAIQGVSLNPPPIQLDDASFDWTFNTVVPAERITQRDHWFRADFTTRLLNDPVDTVAVPNEHAAVSSNVLVSTFDAVFHNPLTGLEELYNLGPSTVGFPREVHRRVDLTVTEPRLTLVKEVCNEVLYGTGPSCSNFVPLANDGDAFDTYVYRVTVTNEASGAGVARAPAYDVTVTHDFDATDMLFVDPLAGDGLDDDADAAIDAADADGEGVVTDNVTQNGVPAQVIASYTHSTELLRIDAGQSRTLYYRVDPDDDVAPLQALTNTVTASYDSLEGDTGSQSAPQGANGEAGGARQYVSAPAEATIQIIPVEVSPKRITRTANTPLVPSSQPQPVSIGEEIEFQLEAMIPVAQLRSFRVRDDLPAGLGCSEAPVVDLGAPPYDAAGFVPGGVFTPTCTDTQVLWDFGDQTVTQAPGGAARFDFDLFFVARVDNAIGNQDGLSIQNGGAATTTEVSYIDELGVSVVLPIEAATVLVREPQITLSKAFSVVQADAADVPTVTVTATNDGTATAYNLRVLEDLTGVDLAYVGNVGGANPPSVDTATFGAERPLFSWAPDVPIAPGGSISFTFEVRLADTVEPHQILPNTIQADWTSLPGASTALNSSGAIGAEGSATGMRIGALPNAGDPLNDYEAQAADSLDVPPLTVTKTDLQPGLAPEIGAHKSFRVSLALPEGVTRNVVMTDRLDSGTVSYVLADNAAFDVSYEFVGIATINGQPPGEGALGAVPADGASGAAVWSIGDVVTVTEDDIAAAAVSPEIRITYFARIHNDLVTDAGDSLQNGALLNYTNGETGLTEAYTDAPAAVVAIEPSLTATKTLANVTAGKAAGDPPAFNDTLEYVVTIVNNGTAIAHDVNVVDTLPPELTLTAGFTPTATVNTVPVAGFVPTPVGAPAGPLVWGAGNGDESLDVPPGGFLDLTYRVVVSTPIPDPDVLENRVWVDWTSLDAASVHERTGAGCPTTTPPDDYCFGPAIASGVAQPVAAPDPTLKQNTQATASIGEAFAYRITIPATPYAFPIYDLQIHDDLTASAANLRFVSVAKVSGSGTWTPANTGTPTNLVIEGAGAGIDVPAGEQIVLDVTVVLEDTPTNVAGLTFTNTASYLYNWIDGDPTSQRPGLPSTTAPMTIVGPNPIHMDKRGPAQMTIGAPATFTLDVHNTGGGAAYDMTITDQLPDGPTGGMCDVAPAAFTAQVFAADGVTPVSAPLAEGTDFATAYQGPPTCRFTVVTQTPAAAIGPDQRLIVTYQSELDPDTQDAVVLTNVAGATEWFSAPNPDRRQYTGVLTDGTPGVLDHEDASTTASALPQLRFEKTVTNVTSGASPALTAQPGETLRYRLEVENLGTVAVASFSLYDELDRLNPSAFFVPGTLQLVSVPAGADTSGTSATGGGLGGGLVDVGGLALPSQGSTVVLEFEVTLASPLSNAAAVTNQSELRIGGISFAVSDDPNVNGPASPAVAGDEDPTVLLIQSAPAFEVQKTSTDLSGDPNVLLAGETLRYTLTVKNIGNDNATDATLRDQIPVNARYVAGSTRLNGTPVADLSGGVPALAGGILVYAPEDPTPGAMRADPDPAAANVATVEFDVIVDPGLPDGTVISNQGFVSAVAGGVVDQPSDDPATPVPDDPTRNVVGNLPLIFAAKDAALQVDLGTPGVVDPGDVVRYTITIRNSGAIPATNAVLSDAVPANTSYVADSVTLNGLPAGRPDGGVSPLIAGIPVGSADLTPPLPGAGMGTISAGQTAVVTFDLQVGAGVPAGTIISNQALVSSAELPNLLTDGDGNPATGPEPTIVVVGAGQQLVVTKSVAVVGGGAAAAGAQLEYLVRVTNVATTPATNVVITDDLDLPVANQLVYVPGSATLNGLPTGVTLAGSLITADYSTTHGPLAPGQSIVLRFLAGIEPSLAIGTTITNEGTVSWNNPPQTDSARVSLDVGGMPGVGLLSGAFWHDADFDLAQGAGERSLAGWTVELQRNGQVVHSVLTDAAGAYQIAGVVPNDVNGDQYALRFLAPGAGASTAALGRADSPSPFINEPQAITNLVVPSGSNLLGLNLPIQPNGVVYDSVQRLPIAGATVRLLNASSGSPLPAACFDDPVQQGQVTLPDGHYKLDLNFSDPACPSGGSYVIDVSGAAAGYGSGVSGIIPPITDGSTTPLSVPTCPGTGSDAVPATALHCEVQATEAAPPSSVAARAPGTDFHTHLLLDSSQQPGSAQVFNNHLALDPVQNAAVAITKTTPQTNVVLGQLVPYEITISNQVSVDLLDLTVVDRYPAGFRYVPGSARIDGVPTEPAAAGRELSWAGVGVAASGSRTLQLLLGVGAGVGEGEYMNRAQVVSGVGNVALSGEATATVRVVPDPDFACTDVFGKVFDDADRDGVQDRGERGLQGVRLVTPRGLVATTDEHGRYHITCAIVPHPDRGSNMVLKLDDRSLPTGYRLSTRQTQVKRATRGKALRMNYAASVHRVVGLDLADAVFEPGTTEMRALWQPRVDRLLEQLEAAPSTLRLSYVADVEDERLVERRLAAVKRQVADAWKAKHDDPLEIEPEVYWRRGAPVGGGSVRVPSFDTWTPIGPARFGAAGSVDVAPGEATERILPPDQTPTPWTQDPEQLATELADRVEERRVVRESAETVKLKNVVPPIRFESGVHRIPPSTVAQLRERLDGMQDLANVRLHLVGHADDRPLSPAIAAEYGDNAGLSRERAGEAAELVQAALDLPAESISFSWKGEGEPIASNATEEGRRLNRRVEVEIWYDEMAAESAVEEFVVEQDWKRVKVCRVETVCKMRFLEGHERRARVKNLVAPLQIDGTNARLEAEFAQDIARALYDLRGKQDVSVKFVGYTDDAPLEGRAKRIYGTHLALSKATARRISLAVREALALPADAVASDGRGATRPLASNETKRGRALNSRIEVEFWYDDPLQELPDEPQLCPESADESLVTRVYDPPWGTIARLPIESGDPVVPADYADLLLRAMGDVAARQNVRLRFIGYTNNERLDRRTAMVYGDDIGLSVARARRTRALIQEQLGLADEQTEHEGRGFVHSKDVVNGGFIQGDTSYVEVQVVYDEPALVDDYEGVEITRITRELKPKDPLALNLMRITVDGEPVDDPGRSSADIQRCTDVALERADIRFRFDDLETSPRLSVASDVAAVGAASVDGGKSGTSEVRFEMYTNYGQFIERGEVRVFERAASLRSEPLAVAEVGLGGLAVWRPEAERLAGPVRELKFVLRVYDATGRFDETAPQSLWLVREDGREAPSIAEAAPANGLEASEAGSASELDAGYGESELATRNIDLGGAGTVRVEGGGVPPSHTVWLAGELVPVDEQGRFVAEAVLPSGLHTVEVAVLDEEGNGELFLRDLELESSDWFYVGMADVTIGGAITQGAEDQLQGANAPNDPDSLADGRLAFYVNGRWGDDWRLTASADTREGPLEDIFTNFLDKSPESLFRRMDSDYFLPTYGDDATVEETAPTMGKFYAKLSRDDDHAMWGNFKVGYRDNELALVERGLYGGNVHYQTDATTSFGERRVVVDGFVADPGTVPAREEFRGTGGSLYYLRHRDVLMGSDRLRVELRDKDSGLVTAVVPLSPDLDYDIDYIQGRVLLNEPVSSIAADQLLVRSSGLSGNEAWLVVQYEYAPGLQELDALAIGGEGHVWLGDVFKLGATAYRNAEDGVAESGLYAGSLVARKSTDTWVKAQAGWSSGLVTDSFGSADGGFEFSDLTAPVANNRGALGYRADASLGFGDLVPNAQGRLSLYYQRLEAGYSAPGLAAATDTEQYGGRLDLPLADVLRVRAKADRLVEDRGLETNTQEVDVEYRLTEQVALSAGVRNDDREDGSPMVPVTQETGGRTDAVVQGSFDSLGDWRTYGFAQATLRTDGTREENHRGGVGGSYRINDRLLVDGEVSYGSTGPAVRVGSEFQESAVTRRYLNYALDNERGLDGAHARQGNLVSGARTRLSDSASVYQEDRLQHESAKKGLSRAMGMEWSPSERWTLGADWETGTLIDRQTYAQTRRNAGGGRVSYRFDSLFVSSGIEYRSDETEQSDGVWTDRTTWLFRNSLRLQLSEDWRLLGKLNHSFSDSSMGAFFDGGYTEGVVGFGYRPIDHDRLNVLAKYTYFYNMPATDQVNTQGTPSQFLQKSHVASIDATYDLTDSWTLGGKYAYRRGEVSLDRVNPQFFDSDAHLFIVRADYRFLRNWETSLEGRTLYLPDLSDQRSGAVFTIYRYLGKHFKIGIGYNFTDYSDDLTDLDFDRHGLFINLIGTL